MVKEGSLDYKNVRKRRFFKEPLTEWFFVEPEMVLMASLEEPFEAPLFLRVYWGIVSSVMDSIGGNATEINGWW